MSVTSALAVRVFCVENIGAVDSVPTFHKCGTSAVLVGTRIGKEGFGTGPEVRLTITSTSTVNQDHYGAIW